jgi:UDP-glucuronate 4-epimerase
VELTEVVRLIEEALGRPAIRELAPMQPGDVPETCADVEALRKAVGFAPDTPVAEGIRRFVAWFRAYHSV